MALKELGKDSTGHCDMPMIADWKLDVMCKVLMEEIWINRQEAILQAEKMIKEHYIKPKTEAVDILPITNRIQRTKQKLDNLIEMRTEGDITKEEFRKRKVKLEEEILHYEKELEVINKKECIPADDGIDWNKIHQALEEMIDFSNPKIDNHIVDKFVAKVIPIDKYRYRWYINLSGKSPEKVNMYIEGRKNKATVYVEKDEKYSLVTTQDRQLSTTNKIF